MVSRGILGAIRAIHQDDAAPSLDGIPVRCLEKFCGSFRILYLHVDFARSLAMGYFSKA